MMDWNAKTPSQWEWENIIMFNAKAAEIPKSTEWGIEVEGGIDTESLYSSGGGGGGGGGGVGGGGGGSGSGGAVSDVGHVSSSKSSKSASVDSSSIEKTSEFRFEEFEGFHGHLSYKRELGKAKETGSSSILEATVRSGEPLIGLKLGKRTYFEDFGGGGNNGKASSVSVNPMSSAPTAKRSRSSNQSISARCQVEGCNLDLSSAKEYHRKHKICASHSKCPKVIVNGLERRFCQQCSRFHSLAEFDEKKRSCRKRLSDHNARRRKPQHETIQFNSARLGTILYDGRQQMELNRFPFVHTSPYANLTLKSTCNSKFTLTKECPLRPAKTRGIDGLLHLPSSEPPNAVGSLYHDSNWLLPSKGGSAEVLNEDLEESMISTNSDAAQDLRRALSLLSTNSWGSCEPEAASVNHRMAVTSTRMPHSLIDTVSEGLPLATSENWRAEQSSDLQMHTLTGQNNGNGHFPEFQLFKLPYGSGF